MKLKIKNEFMGLIITRKTKIGDVTLDTLIVNGDNLKAFMNDFSDVIEIEETKTEPTEKKVGRPKAGNTIKDKLNKI